MALSEKLDEIIDRVLTEAGCEKGMQTPEESIRNICKTVMNLFLTQPPLVEISAPVKVVGDIHGQLNDLIRIFDQGGFPPTHSYLFLGDYVDRGNRSLEVIVLLFTYKIKYPEHFFLLRGNHECAPINRHYGFYDDCLRRYSTRLWKIFQDTFNVMPFCALIENKILCMHGGISQEISSWNQLRQIKRPVLPDKEGMLMDLLWADPNRTVKGWRPSPRGISYEFGADAVHEFCRRMKIDLIARAHQVVADGFEFFARRQLVTIFSAPHYCGEYENAAGIMTVQENLQCTLETLLPLTNQMRYARRG